MGGKFSPVCSCYSRPRRLWLLWKGTLQSWFFKNSFTNSSHFSASVQLHHNQRNTEIPELKDAFWVLHDIPLSHLNKSCCLCKAASSTGYLPALTQLKVKTTSLRDITTIWKNPQAKNKQSLRVTFQSLLWTSTEPCKMAKIELLLCGKQPFLS